MHNKCVSQYLWSSEIAKNKVLIINKSLVPDKIGNESCQMDNYYIIMLYLPIDSEKNSFTEFHTYIQFIRPFDIILNCQLSWEQLKNSKI